MSLVNDMLKDLDARRRESLIGKQRLVPPTGSGQHRFLTSGSVLGTLLVFALTVAAGMAYLLWSGTPGEATREERSLVRVPEVAITAVPGTETDAEPSAGATAAPDDASTAPASVELVAELEQRLAQLERQNTVLARQQAQQPQSSQLQLYSSPGSAEHPDHTDMSVRVPEHSVHIPHAHNADSSALRADTALLDNSLVAGLVPEAQFVNAPVTPEPASSLDNSLQRRTVELSLEELDRQQVQRALQQWAAGQQLVALQTLDSFVFQYPHAHQSREALAKLLLQQGERDRALQVAEIGLNVAPAHPAYKKVKARILFDQGYVTDALQVLSHFVPAVHQDPEYHDLMATAQLADRQYSAALTSYQALLQQDANVGRWWYGMATALEALDRGPDAITAYERATQQGDLSMMLRQRSQQRVQELTSDS